MEKASHIAPLSSLEGNVIEVVHMFKSLGVWLDDPLTFKPQINNVIKKYVKINTSTHILYLFV